LSFSLKILRPARKILDKMDDNLAQKVHIHLESLKRILFAREQAWTLIKLKETFDRRVTGYV